MNVDIENLQLILEKDACKKNGGMCESYNYCKFCKEPRKIFKSSNTPCADAYIDMKKITDLLKKRKFNKEYIESTKERIKIWEQELNKNWDNEEYLNEWFFDMKKGDNFGMPKSTGDFPLEIEFFDRESIRNKIKKIIQIEKERLNSVKFEYLKLENAINKLNEKENFIIECRYGLTKLNINDTLTSYNRKYEANITLDILKKKIAKIKRKIYEKMYKI